MDEICIDKYREAIDGKERRLAIHHFKPDTLEDAIRIAVDAESWQMSETRTGGFVTGKVYDQSVNNGTLNDQPEEEEPPKRRAQLIPLETQREGETRDRNRNGKNFKRSRGSRVSCLLQEVRFYPPERTILVALCRRET